MLIIRHEFLDNIIKRITKPDNYEFTGDFTTTF